MKPSFIFFGSLRIRRVIFEYCRTYWNIIPISYIKSFAVLHSINRQVLYLIQNFSFILSFGDLI